MNDLPDALRAPITDKASAMAWVDALAGSGWAWHFDDDTFDVFDGKLSEDDCQLLSDRRDALYTFEWGPREGLGFWYCPIGYLMRMETLKGGPYGLEAEDRDETAGGYVIHDRDRDADYAYGAPDRFEVRRKGALVGRFACFADLCEAVPGLRKYFALAVKLETGAA